MLFCKDCVYRIPFLIILKIFNWKPEPFSEEDLKDPNIPDVVRNSYSSRNNASQLIYVTCEGEVKIYNIIFIWFKSKLEIYYWNTECCWQRKRWRNRILSQAWYRIQILSLHQSAWLPFSFCVCSLQKTHAGSLNKHWM